MPSQWPVLLIESYTGKPKPKPHTPKQVKAEGLGTRDWKALIIPRTFFRCSDKAQNRNGLQTQEDDLQRPAGTAFASAGLRRTASGMRHATSQQNTLQHGSVERRN